MKEQFPGFYFDGDDARTDALRTGLVALDANVLLNLHRYPVAVRDQLLTILEACKERIWVPYQAALEYHKSLRAVLNEQDTRFRTVREVLTGVKSDLRAKLEKLQLRRRHALIDADPLVASVGSAIDEFNRKLTSLEQKQTEQEGEVSLQERLAELLAQRIGSLPSQEWLDEVYSEGEARFERQMPPGYLDQGKSDQRGGGVHSYGGRTFQNQFGDLVLWKELLDKARADKHSSVVLVTDDTKDDWWDKTGKRLYGPRPELVEEARRVGKIEHFVMLTSERFATLAAEALEISVTQEAVERIEAVRSASDASEADFHAPGFLEKLADTEEGLEELVSVAETIVTELNHVTQIFAGSTARIKAATDFRLRKRIVNQSAEELETVTPRFSEGVERFDAEMKKIAPGMDFVIEQLQKLDGEGQDVKVTKESFIALARVLVESKENALVLEQTLIDLPDATAPLRQAVRALRTAVSRYASICQLSESWLRKLESGGSSERGSSA